MFERFADIYDAAFTHERIASFERKIVAAAFVGFFIHLGLIAVHKLSPIESVLWDAVGESFLSALYTPFSFLLIYEVLGLILALPKSFSASVGAQFQIIALIFIRRIFGDIGKLDDSFRWAFDNIALQELLADMIGALVIVFLTTAFIHASRRFGYDDDESEAADAADTFIELKKTVALVLAAAFVVVGVWSLGTTIYDISLHLRFGTSFPDLNIVFYKEMFTLMVFADVIVLLAAYYHTDAFEHVFRNAGFVVSTVLIRLAFTAPRPIDVMVAAGAIFFAVCVYLLYGYAIAIGSRKAVDVVSDPAAHPKRKGASAEPTRLSE